MPILAPETVVAASNAWLWIPPEAERHETDDYLLVRFPEYFLTPAEVIRTVSERPAAELVREVIAEVRRLGLPSFIWWIKLDTTPEDLEGELVAQGAQLDQTLTVLARDLAEGAPGLDPPVDAVVRAVADRAGLEEAWALDAAVFGGEVPPPGDAERLVARTVAAKAAGTDVRMVAYLNGVPVGSGGLAFADGVLRLWGGAVVEAARGRGAYRALLDARLRWGVEHGATMALVKGRTQTSGPILRRAGFTAYGEERSYLLML
ncbi:MAG: GNAT family N-acetyltransferase [Actinomycetota bacterium]|nr:GNAT family N-acetyltransferase [Actinomycetota bacterium]